MPSAWAAPRRINARQTRPFTALWESCDSVRPEHALEQCFRGSNQISARVILVLRRRALPKARAASKDGHRRNRASAILRDGHAQQAARDLLSDCVLCQAGCHDFLSLSMALRIVSILRATAIRATILSLPRASRC